MQRYRTSFVGWVPNQGTDMEERVQPKRAYSEPSLVEYGSVAKLTQLGSILDGGGGGGGPIIDIMVIIMLPI